MCPIDSEKRGFWLKKLKSTLKMGDCMVRILSIEIECDCGKKIKVKSTEGIDFPLQCADCGEKHNVQINAPLK